MPQDRRDRGGDVQRFCGDLSDRTGCGEPVEYHRGSDGRWRILNPDGGPHEETCKDWNNPPRNQNDERFDEILDLLRKIHIMLYKSG